jgi:hypothetical protein
MTPRCAGALQTPAPALPARRRAAGGWRHVLRSWRRYVGLAAMAAGFAGAVSASGPVSGAPSVAPSAAAGAVVWPDQGYLRYDVYRDGIGFVVGQSEHRWQRGEDGSYRIATQWETSGFAAMLRRVRVHHTSEGRIVDGSFLPSRYRTWRDDKKKESQADFDWAARRVVQSGAAVELPPGTLDPVSVFYQPAMSGRLPAGGELQVTNGRRLKTLRLAVVGEEKLALYNGETVNAVHLRASYDDGEVTDIWVAESYARVPLKIAFTDRDGASYRQVVKEIRMGRDALAQGQR